MKSKRGAGRRKPTKNANVAGADKETAAGYQSAWSDAANDPVNTRSEIDAAQANATTSRGPATTTTLRGPTTTSRGLTAGLNNDIVKKKRSNSLHGNNMLKDVAGFAAKLYKAVGSSTLDPHIDARVFQDETTNAGEQTSSRHDSLDNQKELKAALSVIEMIMKMEASKPFNTPVDPVALDIPDYFDIIDTPMDFDTICRNIDLGFKYRNSKDIYRDVELIWDNCSKYNKDGTKIVELMKQLRTKFMKLWSAAGLYTLRQEPSNVHSGKSPHAAEDSVKHNYHGHARLDNSMISDSFHQGRPYLMGQDFHPPHPSCFSYEYRPPNMSSSCSCPWCFSGSQTSMYHNSWHNPPGGSGISYHPEFHDKRWQHQPSFDPHHASLQKGRMNSQYPGSSNAYSNHQKHWHMYSSHTDGYHPESTHADDLQHHSNIPQSPCHAHGVPSTFSAGHPHLNMHTEAIPRHTKHVEEDLTASHRDGPSVQKYQRVAATHAASCSRKHSPARHEEPSGSTGYTHLNSPMESIPRHTKRVLEDLTALDPDGPRIQKHPRVAATQVTSCSRQHSPKRHGEDSGSAGHIHVTPAGESSVRPTCRAESSVAPDTNNCSSEEYEMNLNEADPPLSDDNAMPDSEDDAHLSQPGSSTPEASPLGNEHTRDSPDLVNKSRARGPTFCLKLHSQSKQISITTNELGQPIGADARQLSSFVGTIARDGHKAPLNYIEWRAMPEAYKENMWKGIQEKFIIDPKSRYWIMKSLSKKWKNWKARLKRERYLTRATNEERLANLDERVHPDQWEYLVSYWNTEKAERRSAMNKASHAKLVYRHAAGSKSYARLREEEKEKRPDKKPPSRAELFIMTRLRKDGKPVNEETAAVIEKLQQTHDATETSTAQNETFAEVVGRSKSGLLRCVELGSSPSDFVSRKYDFVTRIHSKEVLEAKAEVLEMKSKMGTMEETCAQMATQMAAMMSMMSSLKNVSNGKISGPDVSYDQGSLGNGWNRPRITEVYSRRLERDSEKIENIGTSCRPGSSAEPDSLPDRGTPYLPRASGPCTVFQTLQDQADDTSVTGEELVPQQRDPTPPRTRSSTRKRR